jgi:hypothetical protein
VLFHVPHAASEPWWACVPAWERLIGFGAVDGGPKALDLGRKRGVSRSEALHLRAVHPQCREAPLRCLSARPQRCSVWAPQLRQVRQQFLPRSFLVIPVVLRVEPAEDTRLGFVGGGTTQGPKESFDTPSCGGGRWGLAPVREGRRGFPSGSAPMARSSYGTWSLVRATCALLMVALVGMVGLHLISTPEVSSDASLRGRGATAQNLLARPGGAGEGDGGLLEYLNEQARRGRLSASALKEVQRVLRNDPDGTTALDPFGKDPYVRLVIIALVLGYVLSKKDRHGVSNAEEC